MSDIRQSTPSGSKFITLCLANWSLHLYVYSLIPLLTVLLSNYPDTPRLMALAVGAFAVGMIIPGPFGAHLMERRRRKAVYLKAIFLIGLFPTLGFIFTPVPSAVILLHGLQGVAFGIAQTALGTTLINDILLSKQRDRGDLSYAWAGRLGIPMGLLLGALLAHFLPINTALGWSLVPVLLSFLLVAQTAIPIKAPVKVPLMTYDRFFIPETCPLSVTMFAAPFAMGAIIVDVTFPPYFIALTVGAIFAAALHYFQLRHTSGYLENILGYAFVAAGMSFFLPFLSNDLTVLLRFTLIGLGAGLVSARHLLDWICGAAHCQRGTAQSSYMLSWRLAFAGGFVYTAFAHRVNPSPAIALCVFSSLCYLFFVGQRFGAKSEETHKV